MRFSLLLILVAVVCNNVNCLRSCLTSERCRGNRQCTFGVKRSYAKKTRGDYNDIAKKSDSAGEHSRRGGKRKAQKSSNDVESYSHSPKSMALRMRAIEREQFNLSDKPEDILKRQLFCNVEMNGESLDAVGFDMDFTLAQYNEAFDLLAFNGAKKNLVESLGYPAFVSGIEYKPEDFRRGLIIDKIRGNILKIDKHRYVRKAVHGLTEMNREERKLCYNSHVSSFTESSYVNIDTIFLLVDAALFANLVDLKDKYPDQFNNKSYEQLYKDIRAAVDLCHRDGVIKDSVMQDPAKHIIYDPHMVPMLQRLKREGKKVFLLTNSMWEYTNAVMEFLVHSQGEYGEMKWEDLFDVVIVGASKPGFLTDVYLGMFEVSKEGSLSNIEDKDKLDATHLQENKTFQGGCWMDLHKMMDVTSGDRILYVGDHMYSDILRSKRTLGWRTCLVIPELDDELQITLQEVALSNELIKLRRLQYDLDEYMDILRQKKLLGIDVGDALTEAGTKAAELKESLYVLNEKYNSKFNKNWGQLFKAGHRESRFASQVTGYACLYTSKASNLRFVSANRPFRPIPRDFVPHEKIVGDNNENGGF